MSSQDNLGSGHAGVPSSSLGGAGCPEIGWGAWRAPATGSPALLALAYEWDGNTVVCVHDLAETPGEAVLRLGGGRLADVLAPEDLDARKGAAHRVPADGYGYRWFRLHAV